VLARLEEPERLQQLQEQRHPPGQPEQQLHIHHRLIHRLIRMQNRTLIRMMYHMQNRMKNHRRSHRMIHKRENSRSRWELHHSTELFGAERISLSRSCST
jgi:hypothetical protein